VGIEEEVRVCTPLSRAGIYNVYHEEPRRYLEVYVSDFLRAVLIDLEERGTLISIDTYPESVKIEAQPLMNGAVCIEMTEVALCRRDLSEEVLKRISSALGKESLRIVEGHALFYCLNNMCVEIQLRLRIEESLNKVADELCAEDLAQLGLQGAPIT